MQAGYVVVKRLGLGLNQTCVWTSTLPFINSMTLGDLPNHSMPPIVWLQKGGLLCKVMMRIKHDVPEGHSGCPAHGRFHRKQLLLVLREKKKDSETTGKLLWLYNLLLNDGCWWLVLSESRGKSGLYGKVYTELRFEDDLELGGQLGVKRIWKAGEWLSQGQGSRTSHGTNYEQWLHQLVGPKDAHREGGEGDKRLAEKWIGKEYWEKLWKPFQNNDFG